MATPLSGAAHADLDDRWLRREPCDTLCRKRLYLHDVPDTDRRHEKDVHRCSGKPEEKRPTQTG